MSRLKYFIPVLIFIAIGIPLWLAKPHNPNDLPSVLLDKQLPSFSLPNLHKPNELVTQKDLLGSYTLLNVWATWCYNCRIEHPLFMELAEQGVKIIGLNWRDPERQEALVWLEKLGDPYVVNIADVDNRLGIDLGVYGAPETFLINPDGVIVHKHVGIVSRAVWEQDFLPKMQAASSES